MTAKFSFIRKFPAKFVFLLLLGLVVWLVWLRSPNKINSLTNQTEEAGIRNRANGESSGSRNSPQNRIENDNDAKTAKIDRTNKSELSPDELAYRVTKATNSLFILLKRDESSRSRLIEQRVSNGQNIYSFEIHRNNDLDSFVRSAIKEIATRDGVKPLAIRASIDQKLRQFDIPLGKVQKINIVVPEDPNKKISFSSFHQEIGTAKDDLTNIGSLVTGHVPLSAQGWRFDNLVESPKSSDKK